MPGMDGLALLLTCAFCLMVAFGIDVGIAAGYGWTWWLIVPPVVGLWAGHRLADWLGA